MQLSTLIHSAGLSWRPVRARHDHPLSAIVKVKFFSNSTEFQKWLRDHGAHSPELWVGFYQKSSGKPSITYPQAVDEALCNGWIDGVRRKVAPDSYTVRFTPRRPRSQWSAVNIKRAQELATSGRMLPAGMKAFEGAKDQVRKYSYEQRQSAEFNSKEEKAFRSNRRAWKYFQSRPPWYRRTATFWVVSAKKVETRQRRFATLIADSECGRPIKPLSWSVPKRNGKR